jgi:hypothetical protein
MNAKANQCDLNCPFTAMNHYDFEQRNQKRGVLARTAAAGKLAAIGIQQAGYAAGGCPNRNLQEKDWEPSARCAALTRDMAEKLGGPILASSLSDHQQNVFPTAGVEIIDDMPPQEAPVEPPEA